MARSRPAASVDPDNRYAIGVGSNRGDRLWSIREAARLLEDSGMVVILAKSTLVETTAVGGPPGQDAFLNAIWVIETGLGPHQLLHLLQTIETALGRTREVRWGSRTIDLDLLLRADGLLVSSPVLTLPHALLHERAFVLEPLSSLAGTWIHRRLGRSISELARRLRMGTPP